MKELPHRVIAVVMAVVMAGCWTKPANRCDVWGQVTFKNRPVPAGLVAVYPDLSQGNDGPQGLAEIRNGQFDTRRLDKGAPRGPVILMIDGFDGDAQPEMPYGKPLFVGYKVSLEITGPGEQSIDVPDSAAMSAKAAAGPLP